MSQDSDDAMAQVRALQAQLARSYAGANIQVSPVVGARVESLDTNAAYAGLGTIAKVNRKTMDVVLDNGRSVRFPYIAVAPAPHAPPAPTDQARVVAAGLFFSLGEVVRLADPGAFPGLYVVIKVGVRMSIAKLGGDVPSGSYVQVTPANLVKVPLSELAAAL